MTLLDSCARPIQYIRVSVTDRCNLRCRYCMPPEGVPSRSHDEILRYEEIERVIRAAAGLGISKVRLTGGEPLVRAGVVGLVGMLARVEGIDDLAMTTNGTLLSRYARDLAAAGLRRVNVSLDTLRAERYAQITRGGRLEDALAGIAAAREAGLQPVKVNVVVLRGINEDEIVDLARLSLDDGWHVRFIEAMPINQGSCLAAGEPVSMAEVRRNITAELGDLSPVAVRGRAPTPIPGDERNGGGPLRASGAESIDGAGPAAYYRLPEARGTIGFISPLSEHFCGQCNRLRLTADGRLRPCLLAEQEIDVRAALRAGAGQEELQQLLLQAISAKPAQHHLAELGSTRGQYPRTRGRTMSQIGG